jgi:adenylate cyclase
VHCLQVIYQSQKLVHPIISANNGELVKMEADSLLVHFPSTSDALRCAIGILESARNYNEGRCETEWILPCCGIDFGGILVVGSSDIFGQAVNGASKLGEDIATQWEILLSKTALEMIDPEAIDYLEDETKEFVRLVSWM